MKGEVFKETLAQEFGRLVNRIRNYQDAEGRYYGCFLHPEDYPTCWYMDFDDPICIACQSCLGVRVDLGAVEQAFL